MNAPFIDLKAQYQALKSALDTGIQSVLDRTAFILGSDVTAFEHIKSTYHMI